MQVPGIISKAQTDKRAFVGQAGIENSPNARYHINRKNWITWKPFPSGHIVVVSDPSVQQEFQQSIGAGSPGGGGGQTGGGTGSGAGTGSALAATQIQPGYTGGGQYFDKGAVQNQAAGISQRDDEFLGLDTLTPDERLSPGFSPDSVNWDSLRKIGSRCVRAGTAKLDDDRDTVTISAGSISADYRGLSISMMPGSGSIQNKLLLSFADNTIGSVRSAEATTMHLCKTTMEWGEPLDLSGFPGPKLSLTDQTGQVLRALPDYTNVFSASNDGLRKISVRQVVIIYSSEGYVYDKDQVDADDSTAAYLKNHTVWGGESPATPSEYDTSALTSGTKYYVTAWAVGNLGVSRPSFASLTLA